MRNGLKRTISTGKRKSLRKKESKEKLELSEKLEKNQEKKKWKEEWKRDEIEKKKGKKVNCLARVGEVRRAIFSQNTIFVLEIQRQVEELMGKG